MRADLEKLLRDTTLVTLALAIGLGWSLYQFANGVGNMVVGLLAVHASNNFAYSDQLLAWRVGGRVLVLYGVVYGLVELAVTLGVALLVRERLQPKTSN
jgi:hypothetical protein